MFFHWICLLVLASQIVWCVFPNFNQYHYLSSQWRMVKLCILKFFATIRCLPLFCFMCKFLLLSDIFPPHSQSPDPIILRKHTICLHSLPGCWCLGYLLPMRAENRAWGKLCESAFHRDCRPTMPVLNSNTSSKWGSTGKGHDTEKSTAVGAE